jgi:hypothetical protein
MSSPTTPLSAARRRMSGFQLALSDSVAQLLSPTLAPNVTTTRGSTGTHETPGAEDLLQDLPLDSGDPLAPNVDSQPAQAIGSDPPETSPANRRVKFKTPPAFALIDDDEPLVDVPHNSTKTITLGGQTLTLSSEPADTSSLSIGRLYDKTKRGDLTPDQMTDFVTFATKNVLRKRLNQVSVSATDDNALQNLSSLQNQLTSLRDHLHTCDMDGVFDILYPVNSQITPDIHPRGPTNLFTAYVSLDPGCQP